jgi:mxaA protein
MRPSVCRSACPLLAAGFMALAAVPPAWAAAPVSATVEEPRAFGHVIGDVLTQRVLLQSGGEDVGAVALPSGGRTGIWFERRDARIETDAQGRRWLALDYQIVNSPPALSAVALPSMTLSARTGTVLQVPEWTISVAPLSPKAAFATGDLQALRPDRLALPAPAAALRHKLAWALGMLVVTLIAWAAWWQWRNRREAANLPFARAWSEMRRLKRSDLDTHAPAWLCLHRALNETAGQVVHGGSLSRVFAQAPYLRGFAPQLERFYQLSGERFFANAPPGARFALLDLCRALYRAERRGQP